jgi:hypothetical protein
MTELVVFEKVQSLPPNDVALVDFALSNAFPYYFYEATHNHMQFAHGLMLRNENYLPVTGQINSNFYGAFESFFLRLCKDNNINVRTILRASINCTAHTDKEYGDIHLDHDTFQHYNFLFYMNEVDGGNTYIFDNQNTLVKEIQHAKHKMVVFNGHPHAQGFCKPNQHRFVFVVTFLGGIEAPKGLRNDS